MTPLFNWSIPQEQWIHPIRIPIRQGDLNGESILTRASIVSAVTEQAIERNRFLAIAFDLKDERAEWCSPFDEILCKFDDDGKTLIALEMASDEANKQMRCPQFIQNDEWPMCCGRSMQFVGQIDDDVICQEPPPDCELWWHDVASFYVYTCAMCLECKAIGQQY